MLEKIFSHSISVYNKSDNFDMLNCAFELPVNFLVVGIYLVLSYKHER